jgi:hypothetical protein
MSGAPPAPARILSLFARELIAGDELIGSGFVVTRGARMWNGKAVLEGRYPGQGVVAREWNPRTTLRVRRNG